MQHFQDVLRTQSQAQLQWRFLINKVQDENIKTVLKMELSNENIAKAIAEATSADVKKNFIAVII